MRKLSVLLWLSVVCFGGLLGAGVSAQSQRQPKSRVFNGPDCFVHQALADQKIAMTRVKDPLEPFLDVILRGVTPWPDIFGRWRNNNRDLVVEISARSEKVNENFEVTLKFLSLCKPKSILGQLQIDLPWTAKKDQKYQVFISKISGPIFTGLGDSEGEYWVQLKPIKVKPQGTELDALKHLAQSETLQFLDLTLWKSDRNRTLEDGAEMLKGTNTGHFHVVDAFLVEQF